MKVVIVGGVVGVAARLRRLDESAEIVMVERGPYVSYANCGLPYHVGVGGVIPEEKSLLVANERTFRDQFAIDVRVNCEAVSISPAEKTVELRNTLTGETIRQTYDKLVLSPGGKSVHPPLPGIDLAGIFNVRTVPDARTIREWVERGTAFLSGMNTYSGIQLLRPKQSTDASGAALVQIARNLQQSLRSLRSHPGLHGRRMVESPVRVTTICGFLDLDRSAISSPKTASTTKLSTPGGVGRHQFETWHGWARRPVAKDLLTKQETGP